MPSWRRFGQGTGKVNAALHGLATHNYSLVERNDPTHNLIPLLSYRYSSNIRPYPLECLTLIHHQTIGKLSFKQLSFEGSAFRKSVHRLLSRPAIDQMGVQRLSARRTSADMVENSGFGMRVALYMTRSSGFFGLVAASVVATWA